VLYIIKIILVSLLIVLAINSVKSFREIIIFL